MSWPVTVVIIRPALRQHDLQSPILSWSLQNHWAQARVYARGMPFYM